MIRPISDLPDLSVDAAWREVEGVDGLAYRDTADAGGIPIPYPDNPDFFGVPTLDDEEWDGDESITDRGWVIESNLGVGGVVTIDNTFAPSRVRCKFPNTATTQYLSIHRALREITLGVTDFAVDFDASGGFDDTGNANPIVGVGVRDSALAASAGFILTVGEANALDLRKYSNIGTGAFTSLASININSSTLPTRFFCHLDRQGTNFAIGWSADGAAYRWGGGIAQGVAQNPARIWLLIKRDNVAVPTMLANNWLRWNRYYL